MEKYFETEQEFLANYDDSKYQKPSVTVDMLIFTINFHINSIFAAMIISFYTT